MESKRSSGSGWINTASRKWREELWVWLFGGVMVWLAESSGIYLGARISVVNKQVFIGHPVLETYLRVLPVDVLAKSLVISVVSAICLALVVAIFLRVARLVMSGGPNPLAFHGAMCVSVLLFLYGAVLINVEFIPTAFNRRSVVYTLLCGVLCLFVSIPVYGHIRRTAEDGLGRFAAGALLVVLCVYLFPAQMLIDIFAGKSWADPRIVLVRAAAFAGMTVVYLLAVALARWRRIGSGRGSAAMRWVGAALGVGLAIFAAAAWGSTAFRSSSVGLRPPAPESPNVVLISMDTVRADALSCYNPDLKTTPFVDSVAGEGVLFEQARSTSPWTLPGHASIFTGLYPRQHGATWEYTYLKSEMATMAEIFRAAGYDTAGFSSNIWLDTFTNMHQGFRTFWRYNPAGAVNPANNGSQLWQSIWPPLSVFMGIRKWSRGLRKTRERKSVLMNRRVARWLKRERLRDRPFFLFVNYIDAHAVYRPPDRFKPRIPRRTKLRKVYKINKSPYRYIAGEEELGPLELAVLKKLYLGEVRYEDEVIRVLSRLLKRDGLWKDAVVVITSDHGEYLGEHHQLDHMFGVHEPVLRVPLILRAPKRLPAGLRVSTPVQTIDILPTLLELAGVEYVAGEPYEGRSVLTVDEGKELRKYSIGELMIPRLLLETLANSASGEVMPRFEVRQHSITEGPYQYVMDSRGRGRLWRLDALGGESDDVTELEPERALEMRGALMKWLAQHPMDIEDEREGPVITPEILREIKALGYLE